MEESSLNQGQDDLWTPNQTSFQPIPTSYENLIKLGKV